MPREEKDLSSAQGAKPLEGGRVSRRVFIGSAIAVAASTPLAVDALSTGSASAAAADFYSTNIGCPWGFSACYGSPFHYGQDYTKAYNAAVPSPGAGTVVQSSSNAIHGNYVSVWYPAIASYMQFCHLNAPGISAGATVVRDTVLGYVGNTGDVTGTHLHVACGNNQTPGQGTRVDPVPQIAALLSTNPPTGIPIGERDMATGFIRNPGGGIFLVDSATGKLRSLTWPEWSAYSAQGYTWHQAAAGEVEALIATNGQVTVSP